MCNRGKSSSALAAVAVSCTGMGDAVRALLGELEVSSVGRGDPFISEETLKPLHLWETSKRRNINVSAWWLQIGPMWPCSCFRNLYRR